MIKDKLVVLRPDGVRRSFFIGPYCVVLNSPHHPIGGVAGHLIFFASAMSTGFGA